MINHDLFTLARKIRNARKAANLSQLQLAKFLGVSDKTISAYESARAIPPLPTLAEIATFTKKPIVFFMGKRHQPEENLDSLEEKLTTIVQDIDSIKKEIEKIRKLKEDEKK